MGVLCNKLMYNGTDKLVDKNYQKIGTFVFNKISLYCINFVFTLQSSLLIRFIELVTYNFPI